MEHKLTRQDTNLLKGLAIVGIILHNFCHMLPRIVAENEYTYHTFKNAQLLGSLEHGYHVGLSLLSYFGHYGVPVFLLLSGYGLVMKYERGTIGHIGVKDFILTCCGLGWRFGSSSFSPNTVFTRVSPPAPSSPC